jgi:two-component system, chemotaxis family, protein-glutamate methylesterase/glutaminase
MVKKKIKVLVIDDSALAREIISKGISRDPQIEVVGTAMDVYVARDKIVFKKPDVLTLDIEMPRMDGVEFLKKLMPQYPLPVIIVSSMSKPGAKVTLEALENGAVDYVLKPSKKIGEGLTEMMKELIEKIKIANDVDVTHWRSLFDVPLHQKQISRKILVGTTDKIIALGASTGGTIAITKILESFPSDIPGTVVVQHMPPGFTMMFADKLNETCKIEVKEAEDGDRIITGRALIAPGDYHMRVIRSGGQYLVKCNKGEKVNGHCPSVDVLFDSIAENVGSNALGVMLTGMGRDGARAMLNMRKAGSRTIAQDEKSSIIFGMPKEAYACGGAEKLVNLNNMTDEIIRLIEEMK